MVRNNKGGKNGKKMARKHVNAEAMGGPQKARVPDERGEFFACATKMLGNATILMVDFAGIEYICVIRKKFKGRGKRQNTIQRGTWVLVGERLYEGVSGTGKRSKCDLLEVYNEKEKQLLRKQCPQHPWSSFDVYNDITVEVSEETTIEFISDQPDYQNMTDMISDGDSLTDSDVEFDDHQVDALGNTIDIDTI